MLRPERAGQRGVLVLHSRPLPQAARVGWGEVWELCCAAPRAGALPSLLFTRWPLRLAAPRRRGRTRGDSRAGAAAARTALPPRPPRSHWYRSESCRWAALVWGT